MQQLGEIMREQISNQIKKYSENYEVYLQNSTVNELQIQKNKIYLESVTYDKGYGIRIHNGGLGFSTSNDSSIKSINNSIENANDSAMLTDKVDFKFPSKGKYKKTKTVDKKIRDDAQNQLKEFADKFLSMLPEDVMISFAKLRTYHTNIELFNSEKLDLDREETTFMLESSLIVEKDNKKVEFWPHQYRKRIQDITEEDIEHWIQIAQDQIDTVVPKTKKMSVIFSPESVLDGLGSVIDLHCSGSAKINHISKFEKNEQVADKKLNVINDGLTDYGLSTSSFDDEGISQRNTDLIKKGQFKNYFYNQFYAIKDKTKSTGNGLRQGSVFYTFDSKYGGTPSSQISNFKIKPGKHKLEKMISETKNGIIVDKFAWMAPDEISGSFSSQISAGYLIENGEITKPIKGGLVTGNFLELMKNISAISKKSKITSGGSIFSGICPYVKFEDVLVAGD